jgi:hypothetical protein
MVILSIGNKDLLILTGEWAGFDEISLVKRITSRLSIKTKFNDILVELSYLLFKWMSKDYWQKVEKNYKNIQIR